MILNVKVFSRWKAIGRSEKQLLLPFDMKNCAYIPPPLSTVFPVCPYFSCQNICPQKKGDSQMSPFSYNLTKAGSLGYRNFIPVARISFRNSGVNFSSMPSPIITVGPCKLIVYSISSKPAEFSSLLVLLMISCLFI